MKCFYLQQHSIGADAIQTEGSEVTQKPIADDTLSNTHPSRRLSEDALPNLGESPITVGQEMKEA